MFGKGKCEEKYSLVWVWREKRKKLTCNESNKRERKEYGKKRDGGPLSIILC